MLRRCALSLIMFYLTFYPVCSAKSQVLPVIGTVIATEFAGRKVSEIIRQFKITGSQLLDQANTSGNALISRAANESNVLAQNLGFVLKDHIDDTFDKLNEQQRGLIIEAEKIRQELAKVTPGVYEIKDTLVLDLASIVSSLPFVQNTFFIQSINGLAYMPASGDLNIKILASTLGQQEDVKTNITLEINKKDVPLLRVNQSDRRGQAIITIPSNYLSEYFKSDRLTIVNATINFEVERNRPMWQLGGSYKSVFPVPIYIALYPSVAASISIDAKRAVFAWKNISPKSKSMSSPDRHCESNCRNEPTRGPNHIEFAVEGGAPPPKPGFERLRSPNVTCDGSPGCHFRSEPIIKITDNDTRVYADFDTWGHSATWTLTALVDRWDIDRVEDVAIPPKNIGYDKLYREEIPTSVTAAVITVKTFTGKKYEIELGKPDPNGIIEYQSLSPLGDGNSILIYRALPSMI